MQIKQPDKNANAMMDHKIKFSELTIYMFNFRVTYFFNVFIIARILTFNGVEKVIDDIKIFVFRSVVVEQ